MKQTPTQLEHEKTRPDTAGVGSVDWLRRYGTLLALVLMCITFGILSENFFRFSNMLNVMRQISMIAVIAIGMTYVVLMGGMDLSVGSICGLSGIVCALMQSRGYGTVPAVLAAFATGILAGLVNAVLVTRVNIPAFIATLATMSISSGLILTITRGVPIYQGLRDSFLFLGQGYVGPIPTPVAILALVVLVAYVHLNLTKQGRHMYAVGGNAEAARLSGINTRDLLALGFLLSGLSASLSGVIVTARLASGHPTAGDAFLMDAIASVFVGTTVMREGEPHVMGTVVGALLIGILGNGLTLLNIPFYFQNIAKGIIILLAVAVTSTQRLRSISS